MGPGRSFRPQTARGSNSTKSCLHFYSKSRCKLFNTY